MVIRADQIYNMIPRYNPEELNFISIVDRLKAMEAKMCRMQDSIYHNVATNIAAMDRLQEVEKVTTSYAAVAKHKAQVPGPVPNSPNPSHDVTRQEGQKPSTSLCGLYGKITT